MNVSKTDSFLDPPTQSFADDVVYGWSLSNHFSEFWDTEGKKVTCHSQALISFGAQCDQKLLHLQIRINRIENALGLLEKKLGSRSHHLELLE